jgi:iron complex outermembrane receptor protein
MTPTGPKNENTGEFSNTGIEFAGTYRPTEVLTLNSTYSYISMKEPIVAAPEQQLNLSGTYKWNRFNFNIAIQHIQNLYTQVTPDKVTENYTLLNSKISCFINKYIDVFIKGENLTNKKYYINYGYPMPRVIVFGGINLHI